MEIHAWKIGALVWGEHKGINREERKITVEVRAGRRNRRGKVIENGEQEKWHEKREERRVKKGKARNKKEDEKNDAWRMTDITEAYRRMRGRGGGRQWCAGGIMDQETRL